MDKATQYGEPIAFDAADRMEANGITPLDAGRKLVAVGLSRVRASLTEKRELAEELTRATCPRLLVAFASATLLLASSGIWKANAATIASAGTLAPLTKSYAPAEKVAYRPIRPPSLSTWVLRLRLSALLWLPTPILWLRLQAVRLLRLRLATRHHHRYRRLGLALLRRSCKAQLETRAGSRLSRSGSLAKLLAMRIASSIVIRLVIVVVRIEVGERLPIGRRFTLNPPGRRMTVHGGEAAAGHCLQRSPRECALDPGLPLCHAPREKTAWGGGLGLGARTID